MGFKKYVLVVYETKWQREEGVPAEELTHTDLEIAFQDFKERCPKSVCAELRGIDETGNLTAIFIGGIENDLSVDGEFIKFD